MTEEELLKAFDKEFDRSDCYDRTCELRDCCECSTYQEAFEDYKEELGYVPGIKVEL